MGIVAFTSYGACLGKGGLQAHVGTQGVGTPHFRCVIMSNLGTVYLVRSADGCGSRVKFQKEDEAGGI